MANFLADILSSVGGMNPSFMTPSAPRPQADPVFGSGYRGMQPGTGQGPSYEDIQRQAYERAGLNGGPRRRSSLVNFLGGLADTFAELGGQKGNYQATVDAENERYRQAEADEMARQKFDFDKEKFGLEKQEFGLKAADARSELYGRAYAGLKSIRDRFGDEGYRAALPNAARVFGMSPEDVAFFAQNPDQGMMLLEGLAASGDENSDRYSGTPFIVEGPQGTKAYFWGKDGSLKEAPLPAGYEAQSPIKTIDNGNENIVVDNRTGAILARYPKGGAPSADQTPNGQGGVMPTPGSKGEADARAAEEKRQADLAAAQRGEEGKQRQGGIVLDNIARARSLASGWTTGFVGAGAQYIPGTPAYNLKATLDTIKGNVGFDRLQQMRDASPTGGALGEVSKIELQQLNAAVSSLDQAQTKEQFAAALDQVERVYNDIINGSKEQQEALRRRQNTPLRGTTIRPNQAAPAKPSVSNW
jgi:hypothetical protein